MSSMQRSGASSLAVACLLFAGASWAQEEAAAAEPTPEELARELLDVTGASALGKQVLAQVVGSFESMDLELSVPPGFWEEFTASVDPEDLVELVVPIYVDHLTIEEMNAAIEFYSSPLGRSLVEKLPTISQESMVAGQVWGKQLGERLVERLQSLENAESGSNEEGGDAAPEGDERD